MARKKGFKHTEETKNKIRLRRYERKEKLGYINSPETKRKIGLTQIGNHTSEKTRRKMSKSHKGMKKPWSKYNGIKTRFKKGCKKMGFGKGDKHTEKTKGKMSQAHKGEKAYWYGKKLLEETKKKLSKSHVKYYEEHPEAIEEMKKRRAKQVLPKEDTKIEVKIQNFLKQLGIEFFTHQKMNIKHFYQCDILIPSMNLIIECDGDFIHCNPIKYSPNFVRYPQYETKTAKDIWELDNARTNELIEKGFKVLRLWGSEINKMSINGFKKLLNMKATF